MFPEADCFAIFRRLRTGVSSDAFELGQGYNLYPCASTLVSVLKNYLDMLYSQGRLEQYSSEDDKQIENLCRVLIARRFSIELSPDARVIFTNGGSEAISVALATLARLNFSIALPQPIYYCYEQSALRHQLNIGARYRSDSGDFVWYGKKAEALVEVQPSALSGKFEDGLGSIQSPIDFPFRILDIVFQIASREKIDAFESNIKAKARGLDLKRGCFILTPSKDLSLPSTRAGIILTQNKALIDYAERDRYERSFSVSPLLPIICVIYVSIVLLYRARILGGESGLIEELNLLTEFFHQHDIPFLMSIDVLLPLLNHLEKMTQRCEAGIELIRSFDDLLKTSCLNLHSAGFSCFPKLKIDISGHEEFCHLVNEIGKKEGLKLNPSVMFGGTLCSWDILFPKEARLRVNLSRPTEQLEREMMILRTSLYRFGKL
jgi:hypothetical protein